MADLHTSMCMEWKTQVPSLDAPRESPKFSFMDYEWNFVLKCDNGLYSLCLLRNTATTSLLSFKVTVFIQDPSSNALPSRSQVGTFFHSGSPIWRDSISDVSLCVSNFGQRGELKFVCIFHHDTVSKVPLESGRTQVSTHTDSAVGVPSVEKANILRHLENLSRDLSMILRDETFPDVKLICGGRTISAHKSILAARSEAFCGMFLYNTMVRQTGVVTIENMENDVLDMVLGYVYSGKIPDFRQDTARSLYEAADKYALNSLKKACSDWMVGHLSVENCLDILLLAREHFDDPFTELVLDFTIRNKHLLDEETWSTFVSEHPCRALPISLSHFIRELP